IYRYRFYRIRMSTNLLFSQFGDIVDIPPNPTWGYEFSGVYIMPDFHLSTSFGFGTHILTLLASSPFDLEQKSLLHHAGCLQIYFILEWSEGLEVGFDYSFSLPLAYRFFNSFWACFKQGALIFFSCFLLYLNPCHDYSTGHIARDPQSQHNLFCMQIFG
ncbi:hypothetical protein ACJX0J_040477, partial [Zea mays]